MKKQATPAKRVTKDLQPRKAADVKAGGLASACCTGKHYDQATIVVR